VREIVKRGEIVCVCVVCVATDQNVADCLTKVLNGKKTKHFNAKLGLI